MAKKATTVAMNMPIVALHFIDYLIMDFVQSASHTQPHLARFAFAFIFDFIPFADYRYSKKTRLIISSIACNVSLAFNLIDSYVRDT